MADESAAPSLAGIWDRFMTPGLKVQAKPVENPETGETEMVPEEYDFSKENLCRMVQNFAHTFSERRLVMDDGNHSAADPSNRRPQELARYSGEAVIWDGQVVMHWDHFPDAPPPDPNALLAALREKFPRATSVDGLWGFRREVTALGEKLLPNMHQTSPQFSMEDTDEAGNKIGPNITAVSPVPIGHQNGTVIMSKKTTMGQPSSAVHAPRPIGEEKIMAEKPEEKKDDKKSEAVPGLSPEMRKMACSKFGMPDGATDGELLAHILGRMGDTPGQTTMDVDPDNKEQNAAIHLKTGNVHDVASKQGKFSDLPKEEIPGNQDGVKPNAQTNFGKVDPALVAALGKRTENAEKAAAAAQARLDVLESEKADAEYATFARWAVDEAGRWPEGDHAGCVTFAKKLGGVKEAKAHIEQHMPPRAAFVNFTKGGHPKGMTVTTMPKSVSDKGAAFSKRTHEIFTEISKTVQNKNEAMRQAQAKARAEMPDNYEGWV